MNLSMKIICFIGCTLVGFVFPLAFLGSAALAFSIWTDVTKDHDAPGKALERGGAGSRHYRQSDQFRRVSESPAETAFFDSMVSTFGLEVRDGKLQGDDGLVLDMQVEVLRYRLDFLIDKRLIVEIDGAAWHSSPEAIARDKQRDEELGAAGYHILRIPAKHALYTPSIAIQSVRDALKKVSQEDARRAELRAQAAKSGGAPVGTATQQLVEAMRPQRVISAVSEGANSLATGLAAFTTELDKKYQQQLEYRKLDEERKRRQEEGREMALAEQLNELIVWRSRYNFSRRARWEEIQRYYEQRDDVKADFSSAYEFFLKEDLEESRLERQMKHRHFTDARLAPEKWDIRNYEKRMREDEEYRKRIFDFQMEEKPTNHQGWKFWIERMHNAYHPREELDDAEVFGLSAQMPEVPPLEGDLEAWRTIVRQLKAQYFVYHAPKADAAALDLFPS